MNEIEIKLKPYFTYSRSILAVLDYYSFEPPAEFYSKIDKEVREYFEGLQSSNKEYDYYPIKDYQSLLCRFKHGIQIDAKIAKVIVYCYSPVCKAISDIFIEYKGKYSHFYMLSWYLSFISVLEEEDFEKLCIYRKKIDLDSSIYAPLFALSRTREINRKVIEYSDLQCRMVAEVFQGVTMNFVKKSRLNIKRKNSYSINEWFDFINHGF